MPIFFSAFIRRTIEKVRPASVCNTKGLSLVSFDLVARFDDLFDFTGRTRSLTVTGSPSIRPFGSPRRHRHSDACASQSAPWRSIMTKAL